MTDATNNQFQVPITVEQSNRKGFSISIEGRLPIGNTTVLDLSMVNDFTDHIVDFLNKSMAGEGFTIDRIFASIRPNYNGLD